MMEVTRLSSRLLSASKITEVRNIATEIQRRLDTSAFRTALNGTSEDGDSNGWSIMLKSLMVKLAGDRKTSHDELINALTRLVEEADKAGGLFEGRTVHLVVGHILETLQVEHGNSKLYWSVLGTLASEAEYFRAIGREVLQRGERERAN